jgi:two-component system sensor histidine kinase MprB
VTAARRLLRFRSRPLRSRLAILTASAVAAAVAVCALACWIIVRQQLTSQLDQSLRASSSVTLRQLTQVLDQYGCQAQPLSNALGTRVPFNLNNSDVQVVLANGKICSIVGNETIPVERVDVQIAARALPDVSHNPGGGTAEALSGIGDTHTVTTKNGTEFRVYTRPVPATITLTGQRPQGAALSVARPLSEVTDPLNTLALVLLIVSGVGVLGATAAGMWIARTGLRPVDRLTETVEHVARTEDLSVRIPVTGEDEIARLSRSFNSMTASLAASRDLQQQLIADAGHELRTPLTSLRTNIELLERSEVTGRALPPEDRRELMTSVKAQMGELASLIGDLQELSRPDTAPGSAPLQLVAFHEVVEAALERARLRGQGLKLEAQVAPWYVRAEPAALERAVINLLDNAIKFSPPGCAVEVYMHGGEFSVRDHGPGIEPDELPHVFERFWRSTSARSLPGSGLGLSIVARTVQRAGGTVGLEAAYGGGTVAVIRLPGSALPPPGFGQSEQLV